MEILYIILIHVALVAVAVVFLVVHVGSEKRRRESLEQVAAELGMTFEADGAHLLGGALASLHLFKQGRRRKAANVLHGRFNKFDVDVFDYRYTVGGGRSSSTLRQTVACFHLADRQLPGFEVRPENIFHKIGSVFGYADIDLDEHPEFSSRYLVRGQDEAAIRELFTWQVVEFFERLGKIC
ncbi:MAG: hypothetical protein JSV19_08135, partial [Phycisphaerales bacterium]